MKKKEKKVKKEAKKIKLKAKKEAKENNKQRISREINAIAKQNIFALLKMNNLSEEEKYNFLGYIIKTSWDDFLEKDVQNLLTKTEMDAFLEVVQKPSSNEISKTNELKNYLLHHSVPDLFDLLDQKVSETKKALVLKRVSELETLAAANPKKSEALGKIKNLIDKNLWVKVAKKLEKFDAKFENSN